MFGMPNFIPKSMRLNLPVALPPQRSLAVPDRRVALEALDGQVTRLGDAEHREVAVDRCTGCRR